MYVCVSHIHLVSMEKRVLNPLELGFPMIAQHVIGTEKDPEVCARAIRALSHEATSPGLTGISFVKTVFFLCSPGWPGFLNLQLFSFVIKNLKFLHGFS